MTATEHRPPLPDRGGRKRGGSRLLNALVGLSLAGGAIGLQTFHLNANAADAPLTYLGGKGRQVDAKRFAVRLNSFAVAKAIENSGKTIQADHLFLIIDASAMSSTEPLHLGQPVLLTTDGKRFSVTDVLGGVTTLTDRWVQPGIWTNGFSYFEVPASALPGARIVITLPPAAVTEPYQPEVEIDLGLDEAAARKLAAVPQSLYSIKK